MESTEYLIFGLRGGRCFASGWKQSGKGADRSNARMVSEWVKKGRDIVTLHKDDPEAKRLFDQMWDDATAAHRKAQAATAA